MSRTNTEVERTGSKNPSKRFVEFNGEKGIFTFYNKESKQNEQIPFPVSFLVLDQRHTVKGWSKTKNSAIYSNEVMNLNEEEMHVRVFKGDDKDIAKGLYTQIKDKVKTAGGNYVRSIYVMLYIKETDSWEMANISLKGAATFEWNEFLNNMKTDKYNSMIFVSEKNIETKKMGNIVYKVPKFGSKELSKDNADQNVLLTEADKQDMVLQDYFNGIVKEENGSRSTNSNEQEETEKVSVESENPFQLENATEDDDLPF